MLLSLRMINFRRHADTEVHFAPDEAQIIAITGANGAGKSTVLEAVTYALFGESRHGRRYLPLMVRRGAEDEGMQVELTFTVAGTEYFVQRRLDGRKSTATLMANGNLIMQSADAVSTEIRNILGMDSTGFQLAVTAKQNDVMALANLRPAERRRTITRLLRQDVLTKARGSARDERNKNLSAVRAFGDSPDIDALEDELKGVEEDLATTEAAVITGQKVVAELDEKLANAGQVRDRWQDAAIAQARAQEGLKATQRAQELATSRVVGLRTKVAAPRKVSDPGSSPAEANEELTQVQAQIAAGEQSHRLLAIAKTLRQEQQQLTGRIAELTAELDKLPSEEDAVRGEAWFEALTARAGEGLETVRQEQAQVATDLAVTKAELAQLQTRLEQTNGLAAVCDACEQEISHEHKERQHKKYLTEVNNLQTKVAELDAEKVELASTYAAGVKWREHTKTVASVHKSLRHQVAQLVSARADAQARLGDIAPQLAQSDVEDVDLTQLRALEVAARTKRDNALAFEKQESEFARLNEQLVEAEAELVTASTRVTEAQAAVEAAKPDAELVAAHEQLKALETQREMERQILNAVTTEQVKARERKSGVQRLIADARLQIERAATVRKQAEQAGKAAWLLEETAERLATQIRPALEGEISAILSRLSEGRFNSVVLSEDYDIEVFDDGTHRNMAELSGGEQVLVALATRLALSQVVAGRQPHGGLRLLILDEVFGSQDAARREAIMQALRALREDYGQILLISHVPGLEEVADRVLDIQLEETDSGIPVAELTAA